MTYDNSVEILFDDVDVTLHRGEDSLEVYDDIPNNLVAESDTVIEIVQPDPLILSHIGCSNYGAGGGIGTGGGGSGPDLDLPHTGTYSGVRAKRGFTKVELSWIEFNVPDHAKYTAIWRSESNDSSLATLIGSSDVPAFVDTVNPDTSYYYWVQGVAHGGNTTELFGPVFSNISQDKNAVLVFLGLAGLNQELADIEQRMRDLVFTTREEILDEVEIVLAQFQDQLDSFVDLFNSNLAALRQSLEGLIATEVSRIDANIAHLVNENINRIAAINTLSQELVTESQTREAQIADLQLQIDALNLTIDTRVNDLNETLTTDIATLSASITSERTIRITETSALAQTIDTLTATVSSDIADTRAQVQEINTAFATLDTALAQRILTLEATVTTDSSEVRALIEQESTARATLTEAVASQINTLTASVNTESASTLARITEESTARSDETSALATLFNQLETTFNGNNIATNARITDEITARSDANSALAQQILNLTTRFEGDIADTESAINVERIARSDADSALASQITEIETNYVTAEANLNARITDELTSIVTANSAFAESLLDLESLIETRFGTVSADVTNRFTTMTTEYEAIASSFLDLSASFSNTEQSLNETNSAITIEATARADADEALATQITNLDASFQGLLDTAVANFNSEITILTNKDLARATQITNLETEFNTLLSDSIATINTQITTLTNADSALATSITDLRTEWTGLLDTTEANFNSQINVLTNENQSRVTDITNLSAQIDGAEGNAVATANSYTNAQVGYCVIGGEVSDHVTKSTCEANGGTWQRLPLAEALDMVSISYTDATGNTVTGSAGSLFETIADDLGNVSSRAWLGVDVNGRVTGLNITATNGSTNTSSIDAVASQFSISHPDTLDKVFFFNTSDRTAYFKGKLILGDGTNVDGISDLQGPQGPTGPAGPSGTPVTIGAWSNHTGGTFAHKEANGGNWDRLVGEPYDSFFTFELGDTVVASGAIRWVLHDLEGKINVYNTIQNLVGDVSLQLTNDVTNNVSAKLIHNPSGAALFQNFYSVIGGERGDDGTNGLDGQPGVDGLDGRDGSYVSYIFKLSNSSLTPTGGSFDGTTEVIPSGWSDNPVVSSTVKTQISTVRYIHNPDTGLWVKASGWSPSVQWNGNNGSSAVIGTWNHTNGFSAVREPNGGSWDVVPGQDYESHYTFERDNVVLSSGTVKWELYLMDGGMNVHDNIYNKSGDNVTLTITNDGTKRVSVKLTHVLSGVSLHQDFYSVVGGDQGTDGQPGVDGINGKDGSYVSWVYKLSNSPVTPVGGSFNGTTEVIPSGWNDNPVYSPTIKTQVSRARYTQNTNGTWSRTTDWSTSVQWLGQDGQDGSDGSDGINAVFGAWDHTNGFSAVKFSDGSFNPPIGYQDSNYTFYRGNQVIATGTLRWGVYRSNGDINTFVPTQNGEQVTYQLINDETPRVTVIFTHTASGAKISQDFYTISNGATGAVGPGFYTIVNSNGVFPASSTATSDFLSNLGQAPKANDHLTYTNSARTASETKRYDGSAWVAPTLLVNGDILALGTITGQHIAAGTINAGHIQVGTIDTQHLAANAVSASKIDVNDLFAQNISATGTITGAQLVGSKLSTSTSSTAFRALIEDDGTYITWMGAGSKTDANGTFWIKKDGTGFISGKLFEGEIIETQVNSFYSSASTFKTVSVIHNSAGKPVEITFRSAITVHIAGNSVNDQSKLRMLVKVKRGTTTLHSESYPPNYVEWIYEPEVSIDRTVFVFRDTDFIFDDLSTEGARTYTLEVSLTNSGTSGTVAVPSIRGSIKTNENKLASS